VFPEKIKKKRRRVRKRRRARIIHRICTIKENTAETERKKEGDCGIDREERIIKRRGPN